MFTCICGKAAFYSDFMVLLSETITSENGYYELQPIRKIKYYTCINCDRRWLYSAASGVFITADGESLI